MFRQYLMKKDWARWYAISESRILPSKVKPLVHCSKASSRTNGTEKYPFPKGGLGDGGLEPIVLRLILTQQWNISGPVYDVALPRCRGEVSVQEQAIRQRTKTVSQLAIDNVSEGGHFRPLQTTWQDRPQRGFDQVERLNIIFLEKLNSTTPFKFIFFK